MVEVGATECTHEEVVGQRELLGPLPELHLATVEIPHGVAADGRHGRKHVVTPAVDLLDVVVVGVDGAEEHLIGRQTDRRRIDPERRIAKLGEPRVGFPVTVPDAQVGEDGAIMVTLSSLLLRRLGDPVSAREEPVEVIEAAVLRIEDHDGFYLGEVCSGRLGSVENCTKDRDECAAQTRQRP